MPLSLTAKLAACAWGIPTEVSRSVVIAVRTGDVEGAVNLALMNELLPFYVGFTVAELMSYRIRISNMRTMWTARQLEWSVRDTRKLL